MYFIGGKSSQNGGILESSWLENNEEAEEKKIVLRLIFFADESHTDETSTKSLRTTKQSLYKKDYFGASLLAKTLSPSEVVLNIFALL
jgi:hypothetical protein